MDSKFKIVDLWGFAIINAGNILATESQKAIIIDAIEVKTGVYSHKSLNKMQLITTESTPSLSSPTIYSLFYLAGKR